MAGELDFKEEANNCFRMAESESHADIKAILMGMGHGWLTFANRPRASSDHKEPIDEPTDEPVDDLV